MRKAGQVGLWLVLAAASWTPVAAMAQDDMFPDGPPQLASDEPVVAAASTAWHDAWRASVETHLRAVAARGTPRDLLVAGWLWPVEDEEERIEAANSFFRPQARAWIQAAYDGARGDDVLVDWTLLDACEMAGATCDRAVLLQRLMAADPGNAEILLTAYQDAHERGDAEAAERYWQAASEGERYHSRINELGALMASVLRQAHAPAMDPALATALGKDLGLGRSATPDDMANMAVMSLNAAIAMPTLRAITQRCTARVGLLPDGTLAACRRPASWNGPTRRPTAPPRVNACAALPGSTRTPFAGTSSRRRGARCPRTISTASSAMANSPRCAISCSSTASPSNRPRAGFPRIRSGAHY